MGICLYFPHNIPPGGSVTKTTGKILEPFLKGKMTDAVCSSQTLTGTFCSPISKPLSNLKSKTKQKHVLPSFVVVCLDKMDQIEEVNSTPGVAFCLQKICRGKN